MPKRPWWYLNLVGVLGGLLMALLSLTPSLLPRPALLQGAVSGLSFAVGYAVGVGLSILVMRFTPWRPTERTQRRVWIGIFVFVIFTASGVGVLALSWQNQVRELVDMPPIDVVHSGLFLVGALPAGVLGLLIGRGLRTLYRLITRRTGRVLSVLITAAAAGVTVALLGTVVLFGMDRIYAASNAAAEEGVSEPTSAYRSAGPDSAIAWDDLGRHGAAFIAGGPSAREITDLTGVQALDPVRVYAGLASAPTAEERAALAVSELERTGGFDRDYLVVATATGSGWLEPQSMDAVEYLHAGNTAIVSMQYAYTPSWVSFVFDPDAPVAAARVLFEAVERHVREMPEQDRPRLLSYGLSLGAHGSQSTFSDLADLRARTDGALFVGSPNATPLWRELQAERDPASPVWLPVLNDGREVRWFGQNSDFGALPGPWDTPRVAYMQHATDPVTWLGPELLWAAPEWLKPGERGADVSPSMHWIPVVTALQVVIDMLMGESVPATHGHNYGNLVVNGWRAISDDAGLDETALARVQSEIESYADVQPFGGP